MKPTEESRLHHGQEQQPLGIVDEGPVRAPMKGWGAAMAMPGTKGLSGGQSRASAGAKAAAGQADRGEPSWRRGMTEGSDQAGTKRHGSDAEALVK